MVRSVVGTVRMVVRMVSQMVWRQTTDDDGPVLTTTDDPASSSDLTVWRRRRRRTTTALTWPGPINSKSNLRYNTIIQSVRFDDDGTQRQPRIGNKLELGWLVASWLTTSLAWTRRSELTTTMVRWWYGQTMVRYQTVSTSDMVRYDDPVSLTWQPGPTTSPGIIQMPIRQIIQINKIQIYVTKIGKYLAAR